MPASDIAPKLHCVPHAAASMSGLLLCVCALLRVHRHAPQAGGTLEDLAGLTRIERAMIVQQLQEAERQKRVAQDILRRHCEQEGRP